MSKKRGNGEGSIYKRKDGRWAGAATLPGGKRKTVYGSTERATRERLREVQRLAERGLVDQPDRLDVSTVLEGWLADRRAQLSPRTVEECSRIVKLHLAPEIGGRRLLLLAPGEVESLQCALTQRGLSAGSVRKIHAVLRAAISWAQRRDLVPRNVASLVTAPAVGKTNVTTLSATEARRFLAAAANDRLFALYELSLATGLRQGELLGLRWSDIDLGGATLRVERALQRTSDGLEFGPPKTRSSRRSVALSRRAVRALRAHRARQAEERLSRGSGWIDAALVFTNDAGGPIDASNLRRRSFGPLMRRAQVPTIRFHDLRHTAATLMLEQNVHPKVVSEMLGHSRISTTLDLYSHVTPSLQRAAASVMDEVLG